MRRRLWLSLQGALFVVTQLKTAQQPLVSAPKSALKVPGSSSFFYCSKPSEYLLDIFAIDIVQGDDKDAPSITASGNLHMDLIYANVHMAITVFKDDSLIFEIGEYGLLCNLLTFRQQHERVCPPKGGLLSIEKHGLALLEEGLYSVVVDATLEEGYKLFCLNGNLKIRPH